jgi:hypothetical protein
MFCVQLKEKFGLILNAHPEACLLCAWLADLRGRACPGSVVTLLLYRN